MFINDLVKTFFLRHTSLPCPTLVHEKNSCKCTQKSEHDKTFHLLLMFFILSHKKATGKAIGNAPFLHQWELTQTQLEIHAKNSGDSFKLYWGFTPSTMGTKPSSSPIKIQTNQRGHGFRLKSCRSIR